MSRASATSALDIDLWLDIETRLILRTREPMTDDAGQPIPGQFRTTEVTEIAFGEQPAALFEPPEGVTRMSEDAYDAYLCTHDLPDEERVGVPGVLEGCSTPEAEATPLPDAHSDAHRASQPWSRAERSDQVHWRGVRRV